MENSRSRLTTRLFEMLIMLNSSHSKQEQRVIMSNAFDQIKTVTCQFTGCNSFVYKIYLLKIKMIDIIYNFIPSLNTIKVPTYVFTRDSVKCFFPSSVRFTRSYSSVAALKCVCVRSAHACAHALGNDLRNIHFRFTSRFNLTIQYHILILYLYRVII